MASNLDLKVSDCFSYPQFHNNDLGVLYSEPRYATVSGVCTTKMVLPKEQLIGIEIEAERCIPNVVYDNIPKRWVTQVEDGSLKDNGMEFVTCPHEMKYTEALLKLTYACLPPETNFSPRTSTHVHFNVRDLSVGQVLALVQVYTVVEKLLYSYVGNNREKSIFCVPLQDCFISKCLSSMLVSGSFSGFSWMKYTGINLLPIISKGTVEFRHMIGTHSIESILEWINILSCIFRYVKTLPYQLIQEKVFNLNSNSEYIAFLEDVFPEYSQMFQRTPHFKRCMEKGVSYIKTSAQYNEYLDELRGGSSKASPLYKAIYPPAAQKIKPNTKKSLLQAMADQQLTNSFMHTSDLSFWETQLNAQNSVLPMPGGLHDSIIDEHDQDSVQF